MKYLTQLLLLLFVSSSLIAQDAAAPSPREIGDAYVEATGGEEAWRALASMKMSGSTSMQGMEFPITVVTAEGPKMRFDIDIQGSPMVQTYDGEKGYTLFPMQGITEPKEMSAEEADAMAQTPFLSEFIDTEARGYRLEAVPGKEVEGTATYGVRVSNDDGYDNTYYFETENMVPILTEMVSKSGPMKGQVLQTYLSDYQEVEGVVVPLFMEQKMNGQTIMTMTFTDVELNPEIEDGFFSLEDKK